MPNHNCLEGFKCPECGQEDGFDIAIEAWAEVTDEGTSDIRDSEWDAASACECPQCGFAGKVCMFDERFKQAQVTLADSGMGVIGTFDTPFRIASILHRNIHVEKMAFNDGEAVISARGCSIIASGSGPGAVEFNVVVYGDAEKAKRIADMIREAAPALDLREKDGDALRP